MSNKKITELIELTTVTDDDIFPIVDDPTGTPVTKKIKAENIRSYITSKNIAISITGNTDGTPLLISSGSMYLSGGNNITLSQNQNTIAIIGAAGGTGGGGSFSAGVSTIGNTSGDTGVVSNRLVLAGGNNVTLSQSTNANGATVTISAFNQSVQTQNLVSLQGSTGDISFANGNGITFGANLSTITASHNGLTQQSTQPVAVSASNGSYAFSTLKLIETNGVTWATSTDGVRASVKTDYQSQGAYLTTAMQSNAGSQFIYSSAAKNLTNISATLGSDAISLSVGNYITTARASNDGVGLNTAKTNVTWTVNSNGISLDAGGYAGTNSTFNGTNISGSITLNSNGLRLDMSAGAGGAGDGYNILAAGTQTANTTGTVEFVNSNGITFGMSNSSRITASHNGLTQQSTQPVAISGSNGSFNFSTVTFGNSNGLSFYSTNGSMVGSYTVPTQTNQSAIKGFGVSNTGQTAGNTGISTGIDWVLAGSNSITLSQSTAGGGPNTVWIQHPAWLTTAMASDNGSKFLNTGTTGATNASITLQSNGLSVSVGNYITTARASNDAIGLNTAGSNMTWTANSSGLSIDARGYAGTGTTFNGANISGSITQNSAGLQLSMSVAAPGAAAENNNFNLLGANTAGNTTASGSTIGLSGINLTLSGTNGSAINISAPATSSLSATGLVSLSTNGSTISIGVADKTIYMWQPYGLGLSSNTSIGVSSIYFCPLLPESNVSMSWVEQVWSNNISSSAAATWARSMTFNYGLYSLNGASLSLISSSSVGMSMTASSNASKAFTYGYGANTVTFSTATSSHPAWDVAKIVRLPFNMSMSAGGQYFWAQQISTASGGANVAASWSQLFNAEVTQASYALLEWTATSASTRYNILEPYGFIRSATSAGLPSAMATTDASIYSNLQPYLLFEKHT